MYTDKVTRILALFVAGSLLGGMTGCQSDADFRKERADRSAADYQQAKTREFLSGEILSLEDCINFALTHNLELKAAFLENEAFKSMRLAEGLGVFPKVDVSARIGAGYRSKGALNSSGAAFTGKLDQEFQYTLLDACMAAFQTRQAHDRLLLREKRMERLKQNIVQDVSKYYFQVAAFQKNSKNIKALRESIRKYKQGASKLFRLEMIDLPQATALNAMESTLAEFETRYESSKSRLRALLGMYPNGDIKVDEKALANIPTLPAKADLAALEQIALMTRPELFVSDIRSNISRTECVKAFFRLWPSLRVYRGIQVGTESDSWENLGWTACNLLKTPELLLLSKDSLNEAELEQLRSRLQGLAVMAQVRMAESGYKRSMKDYNTSLQESSFLAAASRMKKGQKTPVDFLKGAPVQMKTLEAAFAKAEKARKNAARIRSEEAREKALKAAEAEWNKNVASAVKAPAVKTMQRNLAVSLTGEKLRISSAIADLRRDLALAAIHSSYRKIFNALGLESADSVVLNNSIERLAAVRLLAKDALQKAADERDALRKERQRKKVIRGLYKEGARAYVNEKYIRSVEYLKRAAEHGNAEALFGLGKLYWNGQGVARDYRMAVKCYVKSAEMGKVEAMILSGWFYYHGDIVPKDLVLARKYYKMAADKNDERAFYWLGMIHFEMKDYKQALAYFKYAGRGGDPVAMAWVGTLYRNGLAEGKADLDKAVLWYERAAAKGDVNAMNSLYMIYKGAFEGEKADTEKAEKWRQKYEAALKGR